MAVTNIPNVTNWSVAPQNGQVGYFSLMNTWLSESTAVIASLQTAIDAQNAANSEINDLAIQVQNNANIAASVGNYQGDWTSKGYTLGQTVSVSGIYYVCKLTHASGQNPTAGGSLYWNLVIGNWALKADKTEVALKIDKDISPYSSKPTPGDADLIPLSDSASSFGIKKLSWANIKATLKTYFDTLYFALTGNQTVAGVKTFSSDIVGNITGNSGTATNASNLGGNAPSYYQQALGFTPIQQGGGAGQGANKIYIGWQGGFLRCQIDTTDFGTSFPINIMGNAGTASAFTTAVGSAPSYACRAWVNFNGAGTVAIRASGNVSSITDNGVGDYTVNFITAMADANYTFNGNARQIDGWNTNNAFVGVDLIGTGSVATPMLSTSLRVGVQPAPGGMFDSPIVSVSIFR